MLACVGILDRSVEPLDSHILLAQMLVELAEERFVL
jgi:hypothetical protein